MRKRNPHEYDDIARINKKKYAQAPTIEQVYDFIKELGLNTKQFERFFGFTNNHINTVKYNFSNPDSPGKMKHISPRYWHIFYEKIKPAYGVGFIKDYEEEIINGQKVKKKKAKVRKIEKKNVVNLEVHHSRLAKLR